MEEEKIQTEQIQSSPPPKKRSKALELFLVYLPAFLTTIAGIGTIIAYALTSTAPWWAPYFDAVFIAFVPYALIFLNRKLKLGLPDYLVILWCTHCVVSVDLGTVMWFYGKISWWDSAVHGYFGFLACGTLCYLYPKFKGGERPKVFDHIMIVLAVIAFGAIWEVYEFFCSYVIGTDMQDVGTQLAQGINPMTDTMIDITCAAIGAVLFELIVLAKWLVLRRKEKEKEGPTD